MPLPKLLKRPAPPSPGQEAPLHPIDAATEAGLTVVDWIDERTQLSQGLRWLMFRKVPQGHQLGVHARLGDAVRVPQPGRHRRVPGDVLPPRRQRRRLRVDPQHQRQRLPRPVRARHAQVGRVGDDRPDLPAHGAGVLLRRLQVPARADMDHRRRAVDPHLGDGLHRLPAAVRSALLLGDDRRREHQRHRRRYWARTSATSCAAVPSSAPPRSRASTRST